MLLKIAIVSIINQLPRFLTTLGLFAGFSIVELLYPAQRGQTIAGRYRNILFTSMLLFGGAAITGLILYLVPINPSTRADEGFLTSAVILVVYLVITDFTFYWYHRAQHTFRMLWPIHELHHADSELNVTTSMRSYWLELPVQVIVVTQPAFFLIGIDERAASIFPLIATFWLVFTHANIRLHFGMFSSVLCGPQVHRIHHSIQKEHRNKNFAQFFPLFDIIFGTYYRPGHDEYPPTGVDSLPSDASFRAVLERPFRVWLGRSQK